MYKLMTTEEELLTFEDYRQLQDELKLIRTRDGIKVVWMESNGCRFKSEIINVEGKFVEVFTYQPKATRKPEQRNLFNDCGVLSQGM